MFRSIVLQAIIALSAFSTIVAGASLVRVNDFGQNPSNAQMYIYVPDRVATNPAIIVALHPCGGTAQMYYQMTKYPSLANSKGFIVIYPSAGNSERCWDVATTATLTHNGGGDTLAIVNMVKYTISRYSADATKVFVTGSSSGAMMTQTISAVYPDIFAAGSAYSGMPGGCLKGSPGSGPGSADPTCANGRKIMTAQQWGDLARSFYPGYTGARPRLLIWHGTSDFVINYQNHVEAMKQWSNVLGVSFSRNVTNNPQSGYTQMVYGDGTKLIGYHAQGVGHTVPVHEDVDLSWFGL